MSIGISLIEAVQESRPQTTATKSKRLEQTTNALYLLHLACIVGCAGDGHNFYHQHNRLIIQRCMEVHILKWDISLVDIYK